MIFFMQFGPNTLMLIQNLAVLFQMTAGQISAKNLKWPCLFSTHRTILILQQTIKIALLLTTQHILIQKSPRLLPKSILNLHHYRNVGSYQIHIRKYPESFYK